MYSLVLLKLYCNSLLSGSPMYLIQLLQKVQNTAAQITLRAPRVEHISPLLYFLHWLPVQQRIKHKVCSICYATLTGTYPKYISELVNMYIPFRCLHSLSDSHTLTISYVKTKICGQRSYAYQGPATWNDLPFDLRQKDSLSTFKSALKTCLFHQLTDCNHFCALLCMHSCCKDHEKRQWSRD